MGKRDDVAARVAEHRQAREKAEECEPHMIIDALIRMARDGEALKTAVGLKEARINLLEANRLRVELTNCRNKERVQISMEREA